MSISLNELEKHAVSARKKTMEIIHQAKGGHTGGSLSSIDILIALYFDVLINTPEDSQNSTRDRFIMSKGHSVEGLYSVLALRGYISNELLKTYGDYNSVLAGHPTKKVPGIELNSGALGHGLSVGVGVALAAKRTGESFKAYVLMGDGEHGEGSIMEAAAAAGHYQLNNLIAIIDRNNLQISGPTEEVCKVDNLAKKYEACGWGVKECDGNNMEEILTVLKSCPFEPQKPTLIISHTIKGKGVSFIENRFEWHHKVPTTDQVKLAHDELNKQMEDLKNVR